MIKYKFPEEKDFILHYARKLGQVEVERTVLNGEARSSQDAVILSRFFWQMVDESVKDKKQRTIVAGQSDLQAWNEYVFDSLRAHLRSRGYQAEWDAHV